jgi:hypothetical protein
VESNIPYKVALKTVKQYVKNILNTDIELLSAKAKHLWKTIIVKELNPISKFLRFTLPNEGKNVGKLSLHEKFQIMVFLASEANGMPTVKKVNDENNKLRLEVKSILVEELFFPLFYIFEDFSCLQSFKDSALNFIDISLYNRFDKCVIKPYDYEKIVQNLFLMEYLSEERCDLLLESYIQSNKNHDQWVNKLWLGKRLENRFCMSSELNLEALIQYLLPSQYYITNFILTDWKIDGSPLFFHRLMVSPFTFIQLLEQTLVILLFLWKGNSSSILLTQNLMKQIVFGSPKMKRIFRKIVELYRNGAVLPSCTRDEICRKVRFITGILDKILNLDISMIGQWFDFASKGTRGGSGQYLNEQIYNCFFMRVMHMMVISHLNTNEYGSKIRNICQSYAKNYTKLHADYRLYLAQFSERNINQFANLCERVGDPAVEIRIDDWKAEFKTQTTKLLKRILHPSSVQKDLELITVEEYKCWEEEQRKTEAWVPAVNQVMEQEVESSNSVSDETEFPPGIEEDIQVKSIFKHTIRNKILQWTRRAQEKVQKFTAFDRFHRLNEKEFLDDGRIGKRNDPIVVFYQEYFEEMYFELLNKGRNCNEELSHLIETKGKVITL